MLSLLPVRSSGFKRDPPHKFLSATPPSPADIDIDISLGDEEDEEGIIIDEWPIAH